MCFFLCGLIRIVKSFCTTCFTLTFYSIEITKKHCGKGHGSYDRWDEQFRILCFVVLIMSLKSPVVSIDCKKKERLGNLYRDGKCYPQDLISLT